MAFRGLSKRDVQACGVRRRSRQRSFRASASLATLERLESRIALAADVASRSVLLPAEAVCLDASQWGPAPIVIQTSQVVGASEEGFVVTSVASGVVEKWDAASQAWSDVSTVPTTGNPAELLRLLQQRTLFQGDLLRWIPGSGNSGNDYLTAFEVQGWEDGVTPASPTAAVPSAVSNLTVSSTGVGSLTAYWDVPGPPAVESSTMTINDGRNTTVYLTPTTSVAFAGLAAKTTYTFSAWATNAAGSGPATTVTSEVSQDQTASFSKVTPWAGSYNLTLAEYDMGSAAVPTLQSFASATYDQQWVLLAGRTNGLHDFSADGLKNFPVKYQNTEVWVVNPVSKQTWSRSLTDASSGLSQAVVDSLSATNTQSYQDGTTLLITGGYVYDSLQGRFTTYNALTAIDLPQLVRWVKGADVTLVASAILQVSGETASDGSYDGGFFQVTGGGLEKLGDRYQLIFGQNFEGPYIPGRNGVYTSQVRSFEVSYDFAAGTLSYSTPSVSPAAGDPSLYRRRDLNVFPALVPDGQGGDTLTTVALAGVFYNGVGVWTVPVEIGSDGVPVTVDPATSPDVFRQALQQYHSGKIGLYSPQAGEMTEVLLGGISANVYNAASGQLNYDSEYGFTNQVSAVIRDAAGGFSQSYLGELPEVRDATDTLLYLGAGAQFFPAVGVELLAGGIINLDVLTSDTVIGYMFGGIAANQPNFGQSVASPVIFEVTYVAA
jgi:hypothetical protein